MKKTMKKALAIAISFAMVLTMVVTAFAAQEEEKHVKNTNAKLIKVLRLADGVNNPNETFNFKFDGAATTTVTKEVADKVAPSVSIDMTGADKTLYGTDGNSVAKSVNIAGLFADKKDELKKNPGIYKYEVSETKASTDGMIYSEDKYVVSLYVNNKGEVVDVVVEKDGKKIDSSKDPTEDNSQDAYNKDSLRGCSFLNIYEKKEDKKDPEVVDPTDPNTYQFAVSKKVAGDYGSKEEKFPFTITVTGTRNSHANEDIKAYIFTIGENGEKEKVEAGVFGYGEKKKLDFTLKHNQYLVIVDGLYEGTTFTVTEKLAGSNVVNRDMYTASYQIDKKKAIVATGAGKDLAATDLDVKIIAYTNTANDITSPTGILIDNMPYIVLIAIVVGGTYFYFKRNRKENA